MRPQSITSSKSVPVQWRMKSFMQLLCGALLALHGGAAYPDTVSVLTSRVGGGYDEVIESLRQELARTSGLKFQVFVAPDTNAAPMPKLADDTVTIVTIGLQAAQYALANGDPRVPLLSVLVPRTSFEALVSAMPANRRLSAVFIDQAPQRQLELLRAVLPSARDVGIIVGPANARDVETFRTLASNRGLTIIAERAARETELYPVLQSVLRASDVLLALPDPYIINVSTAQNLLLTSFRFRVPVIGHSAAYVRAGALAAVYSTPRQLGLEAGQIVQQLLRGGGLSPPKYPRYFTVSINRQMADSLGYRIADEAVIMQRLQQQEGME